MNEEAIKLTSYFGERRRVAGPVAAGTVFAADALLDQYGSHEVAASILLRGAEGLDRKSTRLNSSHRIRSRMPSSA